MSSELIIPISKTKKIKLDRDFSANKFNLSKIITNLSRKVVYNEGKITQSLYRSATNQKIPPNIIIEFVEFSSAEKVEVEESEK